MSSWAVSRRARKQAERVRLVHTVQLGLMVSRLERQDRNRELQREARAWMEMRRLATAGQVERELPQNAALRAIEAGGETDGR